MHRQDALDYHARGRPGKIEIGITKPGNTQEELALAYTPGVAEPVREIVRDPREAYRYTAKGNLVERYPAELAARLSLRADAGEILNLTAESVASTCERPE